MRIETRKLLASDEIRTNSSSGSLKSGVIISSSLANGNCPQSKMYIEIPNDHMSAGLP